MKPASVAFACVSLSVFIATAAAAAPWRAEIAAPGPARSARFILYKWLTRIGVEHDSYTATSDGGIEAKADFAFDDRSRLVGLAAEYRLAADGALVRFRAWGQTSRFTDADVRVAALGNGAFAVRRLGEGEHRVEARGPVVAAAGYAPLLGQQLLVKTWREHRRPAMLPLLPAGQLAVESRGQERYTLRGQPVTLEHVAVRGLVWGREELWLDGAGDLVAVQTRDGELSNFEAVRAGFEPLLGELVARGGADAVAWLTAAGRGAERGPRGLVALVGGRLVDGTGRAPVDEAVVVYQDDRILAAGPRATTPIPPGAATVDVRGKTVLPGLWDMHAHFEQVEQGAAYLAAGVTTVRDLGNILEFVTAVRDAVDRGGALGPRLLVDALVDGTGPASLGPLRVDREADIEPLLDRLVRAGCLEVKVYSSLRPELVKPLAAAAHRRGLRVTGHVPDGMDFLGALDAGFDGVSHIVYVALSLLSPAERQVATDTELRERVAAIDFTTPAAQRALARLAAQKPIVDPTLVFYDLLGHTGADNARNEPGIAKLPRELRGAFDGIPPADAPGHARGLAKLGAIVGELHRRGVPVVAGTDVSVPGHSIHRELELYVAAGFTPMEAIQSATLVPAQAMHRLGDLGTVERGKRADLVIVAGDPLADIRNLRRVSAVVARGRLYDPASLWRLIDFAP